jgi:HK97 family phage major capsid protein
MNDLRHAALDAVRSSMQRGLDALELADAQRDTRWLDLCDRVDPARGMRALYHRRKVDGPELEASQELERTRPRTSALSFVLPWESLAIRHAVRNAVRADVAGTSSQGGYLVETMNFPSAAPALGSLLIVGKLGAQFIDASGPNLSLPRVTNAASVSWLSADSVPASESDQTFGQISFSPHTVGGYTEISRQLLLQSSPDAANVVVRDLTLKIRRTVEAAVFNGSGVAGMPHGILGSSGVSTQSGASFSLATAMNTVGAIGDALDPATAPGWAAGRDVALLLRQRQEGSGTKNMLWDGPPTFATLASLPSAASSAVPAATAVFGAWQHCIIPVWGGLEIETNPFSQTNFQAGIVGIRALATLDVGLTWGSAFCTVTGVT